MTTQTTNQAQVETKAKSIKKEESFLELMAKLNAMAEKEGLSVAQMQQNIMEEQVKEQKAAFLALVNKDSVKTLLTKYFKVILFLDSNGNIDIEYRTKQEENPKKSVTHTISTVLQVNDSKIGAYLVKTRYKDEFITDLRNYIPECKNKDEAFVRDYWKEHKQDVISKLIQLNPERFQLINS